MLGIRFAYLSLIITRSSHDSSTTLSAHSTGRHSKRPLFLDRIILLLYLNKFPCGSIPLSTPLTLYRDFDVVSRVLHVASRSNENVSTNSRVLEYGKQRQEPNKTRRRLFKLWPHFIIMSIHQQPEQQLQLNRPDPQPPSSYWDNLSKIWLTKRALKELNPRNSKPEERPLPYRRIRRPLTRSLLAKRAKDQQSASEILNSFSRDDLEDLKQFAKRGGPNTSDLRGVLITRCS